MRIGQSPLRPSCLDRSSQSTNPLEGLKHTSLEQEIVYSLAYSTSMEVEEAQIGQQRKELMVLASGYSNSGSPKYWGVAEQNRCCCE